MDQITITMTEFMRKYGQGRDLGWPEYQIEEMARKEAAAGLDLYITFRQVRLLIPKISIDEYFGNKAIEDAKRVLENAGIREVKPPAPPDVVVNPATNSRGKKLDI